MSSAARLKLNPQLVAQKFDGRGFGSFTTNVFRKILRPAVYEYSTRGSC